jgi:hypothetical protein
MMTLLLRKHADKPISRNALLQPTAKPPRRPG